MLSFSINDITKYNIFSVFSKFMIQSGAFSFIIGTTVGFGATNIVKSFKTEILDNYLFSKLNLKNNSIVNFLSTIIELIILVYVLFLLYNYLFPDIYKLSVQKSDEEKKWKNNVLTALNDINNKMTKS
jgi:hypothetical protein